MGDKNKFINTGLPMNDSEEHIRWADSEDAIRTMSARSNSGFMMGQSYYTNANLADVAFHSIEAISHFTFEQSAALLACPAVKYINGANETYKTFGSYLGISNSTYHNLAEEGIPNGSVVKFVADISAMTNAEFDRWYLLDRNSQCNAHLKLTGTAFKVWFDLKIGPATGAA